MPTDARRSRKVVATQKEETQRNIKKTQQKLSANEEETRRQLLTLQYLEGDIDERRKAIAALEGRVAAIQRRSRLLADMIETNNQRISNLRTSYAKALRSARRQRKAATELSFIASAENFTQARSRARWLSQLSRRQSGKAQEIKVAIERQAHERERLDSMQRNLRRSADSLHNEQETLAEQQHQASAVVNSLKRQGNNLRRVLSEQQRLSAQLDRELERIIEAEAREAAEAARRERERERERERAAANADKGKKPADKPEPRSTAPVHAAESPLSGDFETNKGKLPIPIDHTAIVTGTFGRHTHSTYSKVTLQNNGMDFETKPGASARAVFDGTVSAVVVMEGFQNVVLIRHGEYLSVYAGLSDLRVRKGMKVKSGDLIGTIFSDPRDNNRTRLHFEIRHEKEKLNPQEWLRQ